MNKNAREHDTIWYHICIWYWIFFLKNVFKPIWNLKTLLFNQAIRCIFKVALDHSIGRIFWIQKKKLIHLNVFQRIQLMDTFNFKKSKALVNHVHNNNKWQGARNVYFVDKSKNDSLAKLPKFIPIWQH